MSRFITEAVHYYRLNKDSYPKDAGGYKQAVKDFHAKHWVPDSDEMRLRKMDASRERQKEQRKSASRILKANPAARKAVRDYKKEVNKLKALYYPQTEGVRYLSQKVYDAANHVPKPRGGPRGKRGPRGPRGPRYPAE